MNRRQSTVPPALPELPHQRRLGGARRIISDRVRFSRDGRDVEGWALNISRGGLRAILEDESVDVGADVDVFVGEDTSSRRGRIVWAQDEPDGAIIGIEFHEALPDSRLLEPQGPPLTGRPPEVATTATSTTSTTPTTPKPAPVALLVPEADGKLG